MAYEQAFSKTEPGKIEVKTLPDGRLLKAESRSSYFDNSNGLFGSLFRYIQEHDIAMTTPVEARMDPGAMYFWVSSDQIEKADKNTSKVKVIDIPQRTVVAVGARGSYSEKNYEEAKQKLMRWLEENPHIQPIGEPFGIFWNGPFTPWFLKKFEVQVEIKSGEGDSIAKTSEQS